jgi:transcriptional regulator with XRE-family HTH domain
VRVSSPPMSPSINIADLGRRIREARLARRMTLEDVVTRTEFTVSWLSKVENGLLAPSLEGLVRLAEVLGCGVEHLVAGLSATPKIVVSRNGERETLPARNGRAGVVAEPLADGWQRRAMEPAILYLSGTGNRRNPYHHDGERFLHVLEGDVKVVYGDDVILLAAGDSVYLDAVLPHAIFPADRNAARVLSVSFEPSRSGAASGNGRPSQARAAGSGRAKAASSRRS